MESGASQWEQELYSNISELTAVTDLNTEQPPLSAEDETKEKSGPNSTSPVSSDEGKSKQAAGGGKSGMPRTVFSRKQLAKLEERFVRQTFLSKEERLELAESLKLTDRQVMVWFQNRRGRLKRRGPADSAFTAEKLRELNSKRPYPFLSGLLTSAHFRSPHHHPYSNVVDHSASKPSNPTMLTYNTYAAQPATNTSPHGYFGTNPNLHQDTTQYYPGANSQMMQRPCYSRNPFSTSQHNTAAPNVMASDRATNSSQISNVNVSLQQNTNYFNINGQNCAMSQTPSSMPAQPLLGFSGKSPPSTHANFKQSDLLYEKSPPATSVDHLGQLDTQSKYENMMAPSSSVPRNSPPSGWHQPNYSTYRRDESNYATSTPQNGAQSNRSTPMQSAETSPPCVYQGRPATDNGTTPSNVTVNFNNFGNGQVGVDAPLDFPLGFDFSDFAFTQNHGQCV